MINKWRDVEGHAPINDGEYPWDIIETFPRDEDELRLDLVAEHGTQCGRAILMTHVA